MAWDLWGSSYDQVSCKDNYSDHPEWPYGFFFGCDPDVIEEDALNEEYCVQVLRILITKADTEIKELEKDLSSLQNELACAEHEKWPEICCSALTERINWLDVAISALKKDHADEIETGLLLHSKPAETLNEIVKALQRDHCQDENSQQLVGANRLNPIMNATKCALDKESSQINSNIVIKEEKKEQEESKEHEESKQLCGTSEKSRNSSELSEMQQKRRDGAEIVDIADMVEELLAGTSLDLEGMNCSSGLSDGMKLSGTSDDNEEVGRSQLIGTDTGQISNQLSPVGNGNTSSECKREVAIVKSTDVSSDALISSTSIKGRKKCNDSKFGASNKWKDRNSDLEKKLCDFAPKTRKVVKKEPEVATAEDLDPINHPLQIVFPRDLFPVDTELSPFKGGNGKISQVINIEKSNLTHAQSSALIALLESQTRNAPYTGLQLTDKEKPLAEGLKTTKIFENLAQSDMSFPSKLKTEGKRRFESETTSAGEPDAIPAEVSTSTSLIVSTKRQRKSTRISITDDTSSNVSLNSKMTRSAVLAEQYETEVGAIVPYDSEFSESQKKKKGSNVKMDKPNPDGVTTDNRGEVDLQILYSMVGSTHETPDSLLETLKKFTMDKLRAMAKDKNVKKYYKLNKGELVAQLVERLSSSNC
ncbi:uncharacterized protein LOC130932767 isoform X1 [Arachis stenosperma]|uniref:uncharacterized protein LOC130932767 isoform X1 n=1 Tax=Arachis stenosperma TaxID=217475 RepID=UPI0025AC9D8F|nr:uncharacterized protein LOC130932767 isoform X1 [Arachis stenosperma]